MKRLTHAEYERLAWLMEEMGEVIQAIGKIQRHGWDSKDPTNPDHEGNRADLEREMADVYEAITLLSNEGDISLSRVMKHVDLDFEEKDYFHHQSWCKNHDGRGPG